ncbi:MAG: hypothetical protein ACP5NO_08770 [Thermoplasmata archaeon]
MQYDITDLDSVIALKRSYGNIDMKPLTSADMPQQVRLDIDIEKYNLFLSGRQQ